MQPPTKPTFTEHSGDVPLFIKQVASVFIVAAEKQGSNDPGGHDFGIRHFNLWVFTMMKTLENIVTNRINRYNGGIHELAPLGCGLETNNYRGKLMGFQGRNLG